MKYQTLNDEVSKTAVSAWATKELPGRLVAAQVAKLLHCTTDDVALLNSAGKLRALGKPKPNSVKYFSAIEVFAQLADRDWLDDATRTITHYWQRKNARRLRTREPATLVKGDVPTPTIEAITQG